MHTTSVTEVDANEALRSLNNGFRPTFAVYRRLGFNEENVKELRPSTSYVRRKALNKPHESRGIVQAAFSSYNPLSQLLDSRNQVLINNQFMFIDEIPKYDAAHPTAQLYDPTIDKCVTVNLLAIPGGNLRIARQQTSAPQSMTLVSQSASSDWSNDADEYGRSRPIIRSNHVSVGINAQSIIRYSLAAHAQPAGNLQRIPYSDIHINGLRQTETRNTSVQCFVTNGSQDVPASYQRGNPLGVDTDADEYHAFLSLVGMWLGDGTLKFDPNPVVAFSPSKVRDKLNIICWINSIRLLISSQSIYRWRWRMAKLFSAFSIYNSTHSSRLSTGANMTGSTRRKRPD